MVFGLKEIPLSAWRFWFPVVVSVFLIGVLEFKLCPNTNPHPGDAKQTGEYQQETNQDH